MGYITQQLQDVDGDGRVEIMLQVVRTGVGGMMRALAGNSIALDVELYSLAGGVSPPRPDAARKIRPNLHTFDRRRGPLFPTVLLGDVNGDGLADLLAGKDWEELHVFLGVPGPERFSRRPQRVVVPLPSNEQHAWLVDLNKDGKQDVLLHHRSGREAYRVTTLIAR